MKRLFFRCKHWSTIILLFKNCLSATLFCWNVFSVGVFGERVCFYISEDLISQHLYSANYLKSIISLISISLQMSKRTIYFWMIWYVKGIAFVLLSVSQSICYIWHREQPREERLFKFNPHSTDLFIIKSSILNSECHNYNSSMDCDAFII